MTPTSRRDFLRLLAVSAPAAALGCAVPRHAHGGALDFLRPSGLDSAALDNPAPAGARLPRLCSIPSGGTILSWVEPTPQGHALKFSVLREGRWQPAIEVARGSRWFVNWADFPSVVAIDAGFWVAHWLVRQTTGQTYDYDIALAHSNDAGTTWSDPIKPHRDNAAAEHGFVSLFPVGNDAGLVWLDGRGYLKPQPLKKVHSAEHSGNFALRYTTLARDGRLGADTVIDGNVCTCCQTSVAVTSNGPVVAYRGRSAAEIRDNHVTRWVQGRWQAGPVLGPDGWRIAACPVNGPALAAHGHGVAAAWFTGAGNRGRVLAALSDDAGASFGRPIELDRRDPIGRIATAMTSDDVAAVAWISAPNATGEAALLLRRVYRDGRTESPATVERVTIERDSGFPQLVASASRFVVAWTERGPRYGVRTALVTPK